MRKISLLLIILVFGAVVGGVLGSEIAPIVFLGVWGWLMSAGLYSSVIVGVGSYFYIYKYGAFQEKKNLVFGLAVLLGFIGPYFIDMIPVPSRLFGSNEAAVSADEKKIVTPEGFGASLVNIKDTKIYDGYYVQPRCDEGEAVGAGVFKVDGKYRAEFYLFTCNGERPQKITKIDPVVDLYFYGNGFLFEKPIRDIGEYLIFSNDGSSINAKITGKNIDDAKATLQDSATSDDKKRVISAGLSDSGLIVFKRVDSQDPLHKVFLGSSTINSYLTKENQSANNCDGCVRDISNSGGVSKSLGEYYFNSNVLSNDFLEKIAISEAMSDAGDSFGISARIAVINEVVNVATNDNQSDIVSLLQMANTGADQSKINESAKKMVRNTKFEKNFGRWHRFRKQARALNESNISDSKLSYIERANKQQIALALDPLDREISGNLAYYCLLGGDLFCAQKYVAYAMTLSRPENKPIRSFDLQIFSAVSAAEDTETAVRSLIVAYSISGNVSGFCKSVKKLNFDTGNRLASVIDAFSKRVVIQECF